MQTEEMRSDSYVEGFLIDGKRQVRQLVYSYQCNPSLSVQQRSTPHNGTVVFDIILVKGLKLRGRYWTERKTTGEMVFTFRSNGIEEELPAGFGRHPMVGEELDS
jgi:aminopeptidase-like protein